MTINNKPIQITSIEPALSDSLPADVQRIDYRSAIDDLADWALVLPTDTPATWIVNLHGHGSHGDQLYTREDIRANWLKAFQNRGLGILTPNLRDNAWMSPAAINDLRSLLQAIRDQFAAERFVFVSGSMGATGNLIYATQATNDVAGIVALCPASDMTAMYNHCIKSPNTITIAQAIADSYRGTPDEKPDLYQRHTSRLHRDQLDIPLYIAHGDDDQLVPITQSRQLITNWNNPLLQYREIPGGHHDSPLAGEILEEGLSWVFNNIENIQPIHSRTKGNNV